MVGLGRLELPTSRLSGVRSSQLSYRPTRRPGGWRPPNSAPRKLRYTRAGERQFSLQILSGLQISCKVAKTSWSDISKLDRRVERAGREAGGGHEGG